MNDDKWSIPSIVPEKAQPDDEWKVELGPLYGLPSCASFECPSSGVLFWGHLESFIDSTAHNAAMEEIDPLHPCLFKFDDELLDQRDRPNPKLNFAVEALTGTWAKYVWNAELTKYHDEIDPETGRTFPPSTRVSKHVFFCHIDLSPAMFVELHRGVFWDKPRLDHNEEVVIRDERLANHRILEKLLCDHTGAEEDCCCPNVVQVQGEHWENQRAASEYSDEWCTHINGEASNEVLLTSPEWDLKMPWMGRRTSTSGLLRHDSKGDEMEENLEMKTSSRLLDSMSAKYRVDPDSKSYLLHDKNGVTVGLLCRDHCSDNKGGLHVRFLFTLEQKLIGMALEEDKWGQILYSK